MTKIIRCDRGKNIDDKYENDIGLGYPSKILEIQYWICYRIWNNANSIGHCFVKGIVILYWWITINIFSLERVHEIIEMIFICLQNVMISVYRCDWEKFYDSVLP